MHDYEPRPGGKFKPGNWEHRYGVPGMPQRLPSDKVAKKKLAKLRAKCVRMDDGLYHLPGTTFKMRLEDQDGNIHP